jgi:hypothetical protein
MKGAAQSSGGVPGVPVVTTRGDEKIFYEEDPLLISPESGSA